MRVMRKENARLTSSNDAGAPSICVEYFAVLADAPVNVGTVWLTLVLF
jgi:hypothetical protein